MDKHDRNYAKINRDRGVDEVYSPAIKPRHNININNSE